jgi:hypothetical protein
MVHENELEYRDHTDRRVLPSRRHEDIELFAACPKYIKHDLTEEQVLDLLKRGIAMYEDEQDRKIGRLTKKGFIYMLGAIVTSVYVWAISHGFIEVGK